MARSILSFGMFSARAARIAARRRGLNAGSGMPSLADTVISRASLPNSLERALSCAPLLVHDVLELGMTGHDPDCICA